MGLKFRGRFDEKEERWKWELEFDGDGREGGWSVYIQGNYLSQLDIFY